MSNGEDKVVRPEQVILGEEEMETTKSTRLNGGIAKAAATGNMQQQKQQQPRTGNKVIKYTVYKYDEATVVQCTVHTRVMSASKNEISLSSAHALA